MTKPAFITIIIMTSLVACNTGSDKQAVSDTGKVSKTAISPREQLSGNIRAMYALIAENTDSAGLRLKLAAALDSIGMYEPALRQMDTLLTKDSANFGLWFANGEIAEDAKDTARAMMSYARAIGIYPSPDALLSLANLYAEQKNRKALEICAQVQKSGLGREYDAHCAFVTGVYYARTKQKQKALDAFDNCIANDYTYMDAYIEKGLVYFDNGQYRDALNVFRLAATVNALDSDPYYWEGRCYEMMNVRDSAIMRFKQSLHLEDDSATRAALKRLGAD